MNVTIDNAKRVLEIVDKGLSRGPGVPEPGLDLPHGDNPPCVGEAVRAFKIALNDSQWSSRAARAKGMRRIAIAQLGSDTIDQSIFIKELALAAAARYAANTAAGMLLAYAAARDAHRRSMAEIGVEALQKAGSPGCQWLHLCGEEASANPISLTRLVGAALEQSHSGPGAGEN